MTKTRKFEESKGNLKDENSNRDHKEVLKKQSSETKKPNTKKKADKGETQLNVKTDSQTDWKKYFQDKNSFLAEVKSKLKEDFIGNHEIIDQFFELLKIWYLTPDVLTRPIIINLWGMTGCGKTDFVRKLCKYLDYQDKLVEVDISSPSRTWGGIDGRVKDFGIDHKDPFILFFDEIQNYRTVDEDGKTESKIDRFDDLWQILSDGKISKDGRDFDEFWSTLWDIESTVERRSEEEKPKPKSITGLDWSNRRFRKMAPYLKGFFDQKRIEDITLDDLANFDSSSFQKKMFEPVDYSKALIIISGNLDEAFFDSGMVDEVEVDPDIFHSRSKGISLLDIKKALSKRFRPEQISRFGNNHLIYPALSSDSFVKIIQKELSQKSQQYKERYGIDLDFGQNFVDLIFKNGVFPTQGVRPLFSTISQITDVTVAKFLPEMLEEGYQNAFLDYDGQDKTVLNTNEMSNLKTDNAKIESSSEQENSDSKNSYSKNSDKHKKSTNTLQAKNSEIVISLFKKSSFEKLVGANQTNLSDLNKQEKTDNKEPSQNSLQALIMGQSTNYDTQKISQKADKIIKIPFVGQIDKLRKKNDQNTLALVAVHEASHSVVYSHLLSLAPIQIKASLASSGGFIFPHKISPSKQMLKYRIQILLAGFLGEKMIFGSEKMSSGAVQDISQATALASEYVRQCGFGDSLVKAVGNYNSQADSYISENGYGNAQIQELIDESSEAANLILEKHRSLLLSIATELAKVGSLEVDKYIEICQKHNLKVEKQNEDYQVIENYWQILMENTDR